MFIQSLKFPMIYFLLLFFLLLSNKNSNAQNSNSTAEEPVRKYDSFVIAPYYERPAVDFEFSNDSDSTGEDHSYKYTANTKKQVGGRLAYKSFGISYSHGLKNSKYEKKKYGSTHYQDFSLSYFGNSFMAQGKYQKYSGFYLEHETKLPNSSENSSNDDDNTNLKTYMRPDIRLENYEFNTIYVFFPKKLSLASCLDFSRRSLRKGGSPLVTGSTQILNIKANRSLTPTFNENQEEVDNNGPRKFYLKSFSTLGGYGYNLVFFSNFFLMGTILFGGSIEDMQVKLEISSYKKTAFNTMGKTIFIGAFGFNSDKFFTALTIQATTSKPLVKENDFTFNSVLTQVIFGMRI